MADELPTLNQYRLLNPGVHSFSLEAIERMFAPLGSPRRRTLFATLKEYLAELWALQPNAEVILDGSFVMSDVDGELGPSDIDLLVIMPPTWSEEASIAPSEYNLLAHAKVRERYHFDVFVAEAGSVEEKGWIEFFGQVRNEWCEPLNLPVGCQKGIVRIMR